MSRAHPGRKARKVFAVLEVRAEHAVPEVRLVRSVLLVPLGWLARSVRSVLLAQREPPVPLEQTLT